MKNSTNNNIKSLFSEGKRNSIFLCGKELDPSFVLTLPENLTEETIKSYEVYLEKNSKEKKESN